MLSHGSSHETTEIYFNAYDVFISLCMFYL